MSLLGLGAMTGAAVTLVCYAFYRAGRFAGWREGSADGFDRGLEEGRLLADIRRTAGRTGAGEGEP
jgi:hypothetical protein